MPNTKLWFSERNPHCQRPHNRFSSGEEACFNGAVCSSDYSRKGVGFCFNGFSEGPRGTCSKILGCIVFTLPSGLFGAVIGKLLLGSKHFLLEYFADTFSTHLFYVPTHLLLPIRKRLRLTRLEDSQKKKMRASPQVAFVSNFLGFLRSLGEFTNQKSH